MRFSEFAGTTIIPTLARAVLAAAFISIGYNQVRTDGDYTPDECAILAEYGIVAKGASITESAPTADEDIDAEAEAPPADENLDAEAPPADDATDTPDGEGDDQDAGSEQGEEQESGMRFSAADFPNGGRALSLHSNTLLCHDAGWGQYQPGIIAWAMAVTGLLGGVMLLLGVMSRLWGLGLAAMIGVTFYLTSVRAGFPTSPDLLTFARDVPSFNATFVQLSLFVLALGIFLTGPGPLSVDRLLFGKRKEKARPQAAPAREPVQAQPQPKPAPAPAAPRPAVPMDPASETMRPDDNDGPPASGGRPL